MEKINLLLTIVNLLFLIGIITLGYKSIKFFYSKMFELKKKIEGLEKMIYNNPQQYK